MTTPTKAAMRAANRLINHGSPHDVANIIDEATRYPALREAALCAIDHLAATRHELAKPFEADELIRKLRRALDGDER
jgi:hypothetical protein